MGQTRAKSRRFGDFTYREIRECAKLDWLVVIPTGCTEQQGPHLPVDFDTWHAPFPLVFPRQVGQVTSRIPLQF